MNDNLFHKADREFDLKGSDDICVFVQKLISGSPAEPLQSLSI